MTTLKQHQELILTLICGICWSLAYIGIIVRSFRDKTYGMPFWALAFNICWEFIFAVIFVDKSYYAFMIINRIWFSLDIFILVAYCCYGRKEWPSQVNKKLFWPYSLLVLFISYRFVYYLTIRIYEGGNEYVAFIQNLMMSLLFINMLNRRNSLAGQSAWIALFKMVGSAAATVILRHVPFLWSTGISTFMIDMIYFAMVLARTPAAAPWISRFQRLAR